MDFIEVVTHYTSSTSFVLQFEMLVHDYPHYKTEIVVGEIWNQMHRGGYTFRFLREAKRNIIDYVLQRRKIQKDYERMASVEDLTREKMDFMIQCLNELEWINLGIKKEIEDLFYQRLLYLCDKIQNR